ncbi:MAG: hypothetical protein DMF41_00085 [Verrucomicrobia bacterium]|nr:MAG: hypothetical protein DMF41_00085 [Verrucomicrobiota bacterium]
MGRGHESDVPLSPSSFRSLRPSSDYWAQGLADVLAAARAEDEAGNVIETHEHAGDFKVFIDFG